ncbi:MAG: PLP-dependent transferase [Pirellulaceae bacterium]|nr:PLP-dependent transferase [Planctomycetales bacterium]
MRRRPEDECVRGVEVSASVTQPHAAPIFLSSVYRCVDTQQADAIAEQRAEGFVYRRDAHPNATMLAHKCSSIHGAAWAHVTSSGMGALAALLLAEMKAGEHLVASRQMYGRSLQLLETERVRGTCDYSLVDISNEDDVGAAMRENTRWVLAETISNPSLRVCDIRELADLAHRHQARLAIDNTFASPMLCRPLELGADVVWESASKIINGHGDVILGWLCGTDETTHRQQLGHRAELTSLSSNVAAAISTYGLASSPFDCWLALRGLATLPLRCERAVDNARRAAEMLQGHAQVLTVLYPGLANHVDHPLAQRQFGGRGGYVVTFTLQGGRAAVDQFMRAAEKLPFCPSLGDVNSTVSHPMSTSHRQLNAAAQQSLGIDGGTIRLSLGTESWDWLEEVLRAALENVSR